MQKRKQVVIVGGGAAGFFAANVLGETIGNQVDIVILEKTSKILSKVKISGGGRCNVTHSCFFPKKLAKNYPRGEKILRKLFFDFNPKHTIEWFAQRGIELKTEADNRMFPITNSSQTIIDCFVQGVQKYGIAIQKNTQVQRLIPPTSLNECWEVYTNQGTIQADYVIVTTGSNESMWKVLKELEHEIEPAIPSLFTFKLCDDELKQLAGISLKNVQVKIVGSKLAEEGAFLITHWGISGPAVLRLSAWGAEELFRKNYHFSIHLNFAYPLSFDQVRENFILFKQENPKKTISNYPLEGISQRLWNFLCKKAQITEQQRWIDISKKQFNKLVTEVTQGEYEAKGKTTFKEEFVTCGGVSLSNVNIHKMESKKYERLFFAGEVLNIDAITGGFNFQAAWTTSWIASQEIIKSNLNHD